MRQMPWLSALMICAALEMGLGIGCSGDVEENEDSSSTPIPDDSTPCAADEVEWKTWTSSHDSAVQLDYPPVATPVNPPVDINACCSVDGKMPQPDVAFKHTYLTSDQWELGWWVSVSHLKEDRSLWLFYTDETVLYGQPRKDGTPDSWGELWAEMGAQSVWWSDNFLEVYTPNEFKSDSHWILYLKGDQLWFLSARLDMYQTTSEDWDLYWDMRLEYEEMLSTFTVGVEGGP